MTLVIITIDFRTIDTVNRKLTLLTHQHGNPTATSGSVSTFIYRDFKC